MSRAEERAVERSTAVQRSRTRIENHVRAILDAAHRLVETKGDAFTTQELAKEAGVALQTFYRYFSSKDELLLAVIGDGLDDACRRWSVTAETLAGPLERLRFFVTSPLAGLDREPPPSQPGTVHRVDPLATAPGVPDRTRAGRTTPGRPAGEGDSGRRGRRPADVDRHRGRCVVRHRTRPVGVPPLRLHRRRYQRPARAALAVLPESSRRHAR